MEVVDIIWLHILLSALFYNIIVLIDINNPNIKYTMKEYWIWFILTQIPILNIIIFGLGLFLRWIPKEEFNPRRDS